MAAREVPGGDRVTNLEEAVVAGLAAFLGFLIATHLREWWVV